MTMSATRQGAAWRVTVENKTSTPLSQARVVLDGRVYELGDLPAQQSKTFLLTRDQGMVLTEFARQYSNPFRNAVQSRHNTFGNNTVNIPDVVSGAMAASFLPLINGDAQNWNNFAVSQQLDLTRFSGAGHGILLAWDAGHSLSGAFNRFEPKRLHRDTLLRLVIDTNTGGM
jgi:hypothetical protein